MEMTKNVGVWYATSALKNELANLSNPDISDADFTSIVEGLLDAQARQALDGGIGGQWLATELVSRNLPSDPRLESRPDLTSRLLILHATD